jgi:ADP-ribose pyrophosphatase YjhB (NUDIX family)
VAEAGGARPPGGGLESGETHEAAARRKIAEETGFEVEELGLWICSRVHGEGVSWLAMLVYREIGGFHRRVRAHRLPALVRRRVERGTPDRPLRIGV